MEAILQQIEAYKAEITSYEAANEADLENYRIKYLGTKGIVKNVMGEMRNVPNENKKEFGQILNAFKIFAEEKYESLKAASSKLTTDNSVMIGIAGYLNIISGKTPSLEFKAQGNLRLG